MAKWDALHYLRYSDERTRAALDLVSRINLDAPINVADIGCGPGNSTCLLWQRWPKSQIIGIDNSPEMIAAAKKSYPDRKWVLSDAEHWKPSTSFDLIFSNAALHWLPRHEALIRHLFSCVTNGGALAFQIPSAIYPKVRSLIHDISRSPKWNRFMDVPRSILTMESPAFYYGTLALDAVAIDIWETEYIHVMKSATAIVDWIASTGLRPFLDALATDGERKEFTDELNRRVAANYELQPDGKILFPFRRTFVIAYR
jgi:trans-aconitate 2-methyltransferase